MPGIQDLQTLVSTGELGPISYVKNRDYKNLN